jgi:hypothetical protein
MCWCRICVVFDGTATNCNCNFNPFIVPPLCFFLSGFASFASCGDVVGKGGPMVANPPCKIGDEGHNLYVSIFS